MTALILAVGLGLAAAQPPPSAPPAAGSLKPDPAWKELGRSLWFDRQGRRAIVKARVVLRDGQLEHLLTRKGMKEHEAIVATDADPRSIHAALLLTGAEAGKPVQFLPKFAPPTGSPIAIELSWLQDGRVRTTDARQWVHDGKTKAPLAIDWVFAGSFFDVDPIRKQKVYAADDGDLITVANFASAILDLPMASSADDADRLFTADTGKIPPIGTEVFLIMAPRAPAPPAAGKPKAAPAPAPRE